MRKWAEPLQLDGHCSLPAPTQVTRVTTGEQTMPSGYGDPVHLRHRSRLDHQKRLTDISPRHKRHPIPYGIVVIHRPAVMATEITVSGVTATRVHRNRILLAYV